MIRKYFDVEDFKIPTTWTIRSLERELIQGRPRLVIYFEDDPRGLILTKTLADEFTQALGHSRTVDEFFANEGLEH